MPRLISFAMTERQFLDTIQPIGNIMAGDWQRDAPWRKNKKDAP
jgi:hypothetical protein